VTRKYTPPRMTTVHTVPFDREALAGCGDTFLADFLLTVRSIDDRRKCTRSGQTTRPLKI